MRKNLVLIFAMILLLLTLCCEKAVAGSQQPSPAAPAETASPTMRMNMMNMDMMMDGQRFKLFGWLQTGITVNFDSPEDNQNFGRLLDDRSNEVLLNQIVVGAQRFLDPKMTDRFDWGFKVELFYGSDARYLKSLGLFDLVTDETVQPDIPEAWILGHIPISGTAGGLDIKLGKFRNCWGADMPEPWLNVFYSHSYIFNFGGPFYGTGALATLHAASWLDIYASVDRGLNVAIEDNNESPSFYGGIGGSLFNDRLSYTALTHIGPENFDDDNSLRYLSDITLT